MSRIAKVFRLRVGPLFAWDAAMMQLRGEREMSTASARQNGRAS